MTQTNTAFSRRRLLLGTVAGGLLAACTNARSSAETKTGGEAQYAGTDWRDITEAEWRERLSPDAFDVLRKEDTERAGTSPLNRESREGTFNCKGCDLPIFKSDWKYDSGTGWPSFWDYIDGSLGFKEDNTLFMTRTEYHCARCLGHQGHVFEDGPQPTGLRYCNNGAALTFQPA